MTTNGFLELDRVAHSHHPGVEKAERKGRKLRVLALERIGWFTKEMLILYYYYSPEHLTYTIPHDSFSVIIFV